MGRFTSTKIVLSNYPETGKVSVELSGIEPLSYIIFK